MTSTLRRRVSILLVWVLALTGSAAAFSACRHGDDAAVEATAPDLHASGHGAHAMDGGGADSSPVVGAGCDCGCACAGNCNHVCNTVTLPPPATMSTQMADIALPRGACDVAANPATHPPLRPPTASL